MARDGGGAGGPKLRAEWFWADRWFASAAAFLPGEARGLYREMLTRAWSLGARLPADLSTVQLMVAFTDEEWARSWPLIAPYWDEADGHLTNATQLEVYAECHGRSEAKVRAGRRGGRSRWNGVSQEERSAQMSLVRRAPRAERRAERRAGDEPPDPDPDPEQDPKKTPPAGQPLPTEFAPPPPREAGRQAGRPGSGTINSRKTAVTAETDSPTPRNLVEAVRTGFRDAGHDAPLTLRADYPSRLDSLTAQASVGASELRAAAARLAPAYWDAINGGACERGFDPVRSPEGLLVHLLARELTIPGSTTPASAAPAMSFEEAMAALRGPPPDAAAANVDPEEEFHAAVERRWQLRQQQRGDTPSTFSIPRNPANGASE